MHKHGLNKSILATIIIVAASTLTFGSADAKNKGYRQDVSVTVPFADLNLQRPEGAKTLYKRLQAAAKQACNAASMDTEKSLVIREHTRTCYRDALSTAVMRINNAHLTRLHNS